MYIERERETTVNPGVAGMIILRWIFKNYDGVRATLRYGQVGGYFESNNESLGSIHSIPRNFLSS